MSEMMSIHEIFMTEKDFFDKLEDGCSDTKERDEMIKKCEEKMDVLQEVGWIEVRGTSIRDPRFRGAEGRVEAQAYDLNDIRNGTVVSKSDREGAALMVEFTGKDGEKYNASIHPDIARLLKPSIYLH